MVEEKVGVEQINEITGETRENYLREQGIIKEQPNATQERI